MRMIITLFSHAKNPQPPSLKILLTSRPELPVRIRFKQKAVDSTYTDLIYIRSQSVLSSTIFHSSWNTN